MGRGDKAARADLEEHAPRAPVRIASGEKAKARDLVAAIRVLNVSWKELARDVDRAQICFGCQEMKAFGPKAELHCDISDEGHEQLLKILKPYRESRPVPRWPLD